jgi:hypothetical protein
MSPNLILLSIIEGSPTFYLVPEANPFHRKIPRQTCWSPPHSVLLVCSTASSRVLRVHIAGSAFAGMSPFTLSHHPPHPAPIPTRSPLLVPPSTIAPAAAHIPRSQCTSYAIHRPWHRPFHPWLRPHQPSLHRSPPLPAPPTGRAIGHAPLASPSASSPARAAAQFLCSQCTPRTIRWSRLCSSQPCLRPQYPPLHRPTPSPFTIHRPCHRSHTPRLPARLLACQGNHPSPPHCASTWDLALWTVHSTPLIHKKTVPAHPQDLPSNPRFSLMGRSPAGVPQVVSLP